MLPTDEIGLFSFHYVWKKYEDFIKFNFWAAYPIIFLLLRRKNEKTTLCLLLLIIQLALFSQQPFPINGISTNPAAPVNPGNPAKLNRFDWLLPNYNINTTCQNMANGVTQSPFYRGGNTQLLTFLKDMLPEDGWELIHRDFGYEDDNITPAVERKEHSWLVLYNKYTGILRLIFKTCRAEDYDAMKIVVQFKSLPGKIQTNLFDLSNQNLLGTEAERANGTQKFESVVKFVNDQSQWSMYMHVSIKHKCSH